MPGTENVTLFFLQDVFFLQAVVCDQIALVTQMSDHPFHRPGAALKTFCGRFQGAEAVFSDQFKNIFKPFFIRAVIHNAFRSSLG